MGLAPHSSLVGHLPLPIGYSGTGAQSSPTMGEERDERGGEVWVALSHPVETSLRFPPKLFQATDCSASVGHGDGRELLVARAQLLEPDWAAAVDRSSLSLDRHARTVAHPRVAVSARQSVPRWTDGAKDEALPEVHSRARSPRASTGRDYGALRARISAGTVAQWIGIPERCYRLRKMLWMASPLASDSIDELRNSHLEDADNRGTQPLSEPRSR